MNDSPDYSIPNQLLQKPEGHRDDKEKHEILLNYNNIINYQQRQSNRNIGSKMTKTE